MSNFQPNKINRDKLKKKKNKFNKKISKRKNKDLKIIRIKFDIKIK